MTTCVKYIKHIGKKQHHGRGNPVPLTPMQVARAYGIPQIGPYAVKPVAIGELDGSYRPDDIYKWCDSNGVARPYLKGFFTDGSHPVQDDADGEVELDEVVAAGVLAAAGAKGAPIYTVFDQNTDAGFANATNYMATKLPETPASISWSWGAPEPSWDSSGRQKLDAAFAAAGSMGIGIFAAAGDNGSSDGELFGLHVDYPASSPFVTACGGTRLELAGDSRAYEKVWNSVDLNGSTGGGISSIYSNPVWQHTGKDRRCLPDLAGNADPVSGYEVITDGSDVVTGGTSAVAPLMAAAHAVLQTHFKAAIGPLNHYLYEAPNDCFFDVVDGENGIPFYSAHAGYDLCTGRGVPQFDKLLEFLKTKIAS